MQMLFNLISIRCFYWWKSQVQIPLSAQLIIHLDGETGTNLRKFSQEQFFLLELNSTFVSFSMFSINGIVQKITLPPCTNVLQDLPRYFLLHQLSDPALPTITPNSYTWEVAANSEFISVHEHLNYFPQCIIMCLSSLNFICYHIAQSSSFIKSFWVSSQSSILSCLVSPPHYSINLLDHHELYWKVYSLHYKVITLKIELGFVVIHLAVQETQPWKH